MSYQDDPGGNFASDTHRRVLAHLPTPGADATDVESFVQRLGGDTELNLGFDETGEVLADLEADGDASQSDGGWTQTDAGAEVLNGPIATDGGRSHGQ